MTWKRGEKMDGWKKMTLLPLSTANEKIKNKTGLVRQSNDVTSLEQCQKEQGSNRPLTCANSGEAVTASCLTTAIKNSNYVLRRTVTQ